MPSPRLPRRRSRARTFAGIVTIVALSLSGTAGYTVRSGDTLWDIASRLGVSVSALVDSNGLSNPDVIQPGDRLRVPGSASSSSGGSTSAASVHVVLPGETLMGISIRYGVLMRHIAAANNLGDLDWVYAGQRLRIPGNTTAAAPTPAAAPAASTSSAALPMTTERADVGVLLEQAARRHGFTPAFVKAVAYYESGWNQSARSSVGAVGVMQVLPSTGDFVADYIVGRPLDITRTEDNVAAGTAFLAYLWRLTGGDVERTLAGYYQGLRSVEENGMYPSTKTYITNVLALRDRFR